MCVCHWKPFVVQMCLMCCVLGGRRVFAATAAAVKVHPKLDIIVFTCVQFRAGLSLSLSPTLSPPQQRSSPKRVCSNPSNLRPCLCKIELFFDLHEALFLFSFSKNFSEQSHNNNNQTDTRLALDSAPVIAPSRGGVGAELECLALFA